MKPSFAFCVCQPGAESALKAEVARFRPAWRASFSRPGFVTFRRGQGEADREPLWPLWEDLPRPIFARVSGVSLGRARDAHAAGELAKTLPGPLRLHVWTMDDADPALQAYTEDFERDLRELAGSSLWHPETAAAAGDLVFDVWVDAPGKEAWCGWHRHAPGLPPQPGGAWGVTLPPEAPSRAWLKIEEAIRWARVDLRPGDRAVEVGSAPGGASWALLNRGVELVGVDPGEMDPRVLAQTSFRHLRAPIASLRREDLPGRVEWLLLDMNVSPLVTLHQMARLIPLLGDGLLGAFLTLKLNEDDLIDRVPELLEKVRALGFSRMRAAQLRSHRREFLVFGLTRRGLARQHRDEK